MSLPVPGMRPVFLAFLLAAPSLSGADDGLSAERYLCEETRKPFFSAERRPDGRARAVPGRLRAVPFSFPVPKEKGEIGRAHV